jgi:DNA polymerase III gamma/tau subunit
MASNWHSKYRPRSFKTFVGREGIVEEIKNTLNGDEGSIPQTWLISGEFSSGKTSLARLIARKLLGISPKEDLEAHPDYEEINIGADRSIDRMRQLIEGMKFKPKKANYKIILLDEVHRLQDAAASAILKPTEDPPSYVIWIFATNEPQKLLVTIRDRAKHIHLGPLDKEAIKTIIERVARLEELDYISEKTFDRIAENFIGQARRAIDTIQTLASYKGKKIDSELITQAIEKNSKFDTMVAVTILTNIYQGNFAEACQQSQIVEDVHHLINSLLDLNTFLMQKATKVDTYISVPRRKLLKAIIDIKDVNIVKFVKVQKVLFSLKKEANYYYNFDPKQLILFYITKMALKVKGKKENK